MAAPKFEAKGVWRTPRAVERGQTSARTKAGMAINPRNLPAGKLGQRGFEAAPSTKSRVQFGGGLFARAGRAIARFFGAGRFKAASTTESMAKMGKLSKSAFLSAPSKKAGGGGGRK